MKQIAPSTRCCLALALAAGACVGQPPGEFWGESDGGGASPDSGGFAGDAAIDPQPADAGVADAYVAPETIQPARMYDDVVTLTGDEFAGRKPGTQGNELAMQHVESLFAELGLEPVGDAGTYRQAFSFAATTRTAPAALTIGGAALVEDVGFALAGASGSGSVSAEIVFAGYGMTVPPFDPSDHPDCPLPAAGYDDYQGLDVRGKVVLVMRHGPGDDPAVPACCPANKVARAEGLRRWLEPGSRWGQARTPRALWDFGYKAANARAHGAAAMLLIANSAHLAPGPTLFSAELTRAYHHADFPALVVDRDVVRELMPALPAWAAEIDTTRSPAGRPTGVEASLLASTSMTTAQTANIVGAIPGSDPALADEVIVIGGHLDHLGTSNGGIYRGADDNASGTSVTMELARMAVGSGLVAKRTIVFVGFNAEEMGLIGSCHMARNFMYPIDDAIVMLSIDMVGAGNGSGINLYGGTSSSNRWFGDLMRAAADDGGLDLNVTDSSPTSNSDQACFADKGVPAMMVGTLGSHPYYHTTSDTASSIQPANLEAAAQLIWSALEPLARGEEHLYRSSSRRAPATTTPLMAPSLLR